MRRHNVVNGVKHIAYHISGHAHYRDFGPPYITLIGIRNPADHMASLYKYISRSKNHKESPKVSRMTFNQYISYSKDSYLGFLTNKNNRSVEQAITNLSKISFTYLTDNMNNNLQIFLKYMNAGIQWHNIKFNSTPPMKITKAQIRAIREKRPADFKIYEAAKKLNAAQRKFFKNNRREELFPDLDWSGVIV